jgi:hypothetical protein
MHGQADQAVDRGAGGQVAAENARGRYTVPINEWPHGDQVVNLPGSWSSSPVRHVMCGFEPAADDGRRPRPWQQVGVMVGAHDHDLDPVAEPVWAVSRPPATWRRSRDISARTAIVRPWSPNRSVASHWAVRPDGAQASTNRISARRVRRKVRHCSPDGPAPVVQGWTRTFTCSSLFWISSWKPPSTSSSSLIRLVMKKPTSIRLSASSPMVAG